MCKEVTDMGVYAPILPAAELKQLSFNPNDVLVVKIDTTKYDINKANQIYLDIVKNLPEGLHAVGIPVGIELDVENIDHLIKTLESWKK